MALRLKRLALGTILAIAFGAGYSPAQNPTLKTAMRDKLVHAQPLLQAIVAGDFAAIGRSANALGQISETEIASWQVGAHPEYRQQARSFVLAVQGLRDAARKRDIDAALAGYTELVASCGRCHAYVRKSRLVHFESPVLR